MEQAEEFDALPVLARDVRIVEAAEAPSPDVRRQRPGSIPAVQAAAAAAGGFVAGAAVISLVAQRRNRAALAKAPRRQALTRRARRAAARGAGRAGAAPGPVLAETLQIVSTRSLLVDVHLLGAPEADG